MTARKWCEGGNYFNFTSALNGGRTVRAFYHCSGTSTNPAILLGHGWPTSSFDFRELADQLEDSYHVCAVDNIGFGFSVKPVAPYHYSIFEHAQLLEAFMTSVIPLRRFIYVTHDEGDSVGLQLLRNYEQAAYPAFRIVRFVMLNGNVYLPAHLTAMQHLLLNNTTGPLVQRLLPTWLLSRGLAMTYFSPPLSGYNVSELAAVLAFQDGVRVLHETIQYLVERHQFEDEWLRTLGRSSVPTMLVWGMNDPVAVPAVAEYVWKNYLQNRTAAAASYHTLADANHYIQTDHPHLVAELIRSIPTSDDWQALTT